MHSLTETEMLVVTGNIEDFHSIIEQPLVHARRIEDRLPSSYNLIRCLCVSSRLEEAVQTCFSVLNEFGEDVPAEIDSEMIQSEMVKTRVLLKDFPREHLEDLPRLTDPARLWIMKTMTAAMMTLSLTKPEFGPFIGCRMIQSSIAYGWCSDSALGLYSFGQGILSGTKDVDEACSWVKIGLSLMKQYNMRSKLVILQVLSQVFVSFWKEPLQATSAVLVDTHQEGLMEGETECSVSSALNLCRHSFMSGQNLQKISVDCTAVASKMVSLNAVGCCLA